LRIQDAFSLPLGIVEQVIDENKDGFIGAKELQRVLCILGVERCISE
jgi:hypothetical protein